MGKIFLYMTRQDNWYNKHMCRQLLPNPALLLCLQGCFQCIKTSCQLVPLFWWQRYALFARSLLPILFVKLSDIHHGLVLEHTDGCLAPANNMPSQLTVGFGVHRVSSAESLLSVRKTSYKRPWHGQIAPALTVGHCDHAKALLGDHPD